MFCCTLSVESLRDAFASDSGAILMNEAGVVLMHSGSNPDIFLVSVREVDSTIPKVSKEVK